MSKTSGTSVTSTSALLASQIQDETGSGALVFANTPTLIAPALGTPASGTLTNCTAPASIITSGQLALARGGTNADLSGTGGTSRFLKQASAGVAITVVQPATTDLSDISTSTWAVTYTGFSANPTSVTARYQLWGKICFCTITSTAGTSNAATFTITLPFAAQNTEIHASANRVTNNGLTQIGWINTRTNSTTADVALNTGPTNWTNSGSKNIEGSFFYFTT